MSEPSKTASSGRREYVKTIGALAAGLAVGGAVGWLTKPTERVLETKTITETVTKTVTAAVTGTPTAKAPWWDEYMPRPDRSLYPKYPWLRDFLKCKEGEYLYEHDWARELDWDSIREKFKGKAINVTWEGSAVDVPEFFKPGFEKLVGCTVNVIPIPYTILHEKIMADLVSGAGAYDIMAFYVGWGASYLPYLYDLRGLMEKYNLDMNEYHPAFRMHATGPNGEALGLISDADMWAFCVRKNLLEKAGIDKIPDTWEDVLYAIESLKPIGEKEGWYPFDAIYNAKGFCCYLSWNEIAFQWEDYKVVKPDSWEPDFIGSNGGGIEALKVYKKLIEASPPGALSYEYPDGREQWLSGNAAMEVGWTCLPHIAMYPEVSKISPLNTDNILEVGPVPKATARRSCGVWVTTAAGIEKAAKNPELAFLFTLYMLSQESMTIAMLQGPSENHVGFKQVLADERVTNVSIGMKNTYKWAHTTWTTPYAQLPEHYEIGEAVGAEIYRYLDGSVKDPEVALKNAEDAARKILERGGYLKPGTPPPEPYNLKDWCKKHNIELPPPP